LNFFLNSPYYYIVLYVFYTYEAFCYSYAIIGLMLWKWDDEVYIGEYIEVLMGILY